MIKLFCPDFVEGYTVYKRLEEIKKERPDIFYNDVKIDTIFGNVTNLTWNGGAEFFGTRISIEELDLLLNEYKKMNYKIQFTMTNPLLEPFDVYDRMGNEILTLLAQLYSDMVEILVASPFLEEHIRKLYPELKISRSILAAKKDLDEEFDLANIRNYNYEHIVLPIRYNDNEDKLLSIPEHFREDFEILCSDPCPPECSRLYTHYNVYANRTLYKHDDGERLCTNPKASHYISDFPIDLEKIKNYYYELGYRNFKVSGRGSALIVATSIVPYIIKPTFQVGTIRMLLS